MERFQQNGLGPVPLLVEPDKVDAGGCQIEDDAKGQSPVRPRHLLDGPTPHKTQAGSLVRQDRPQLLVVSLINVVPYFI